MNEYETDRQFIDLKPHIDEQQVQQILSLSLYNPTPETIARAVERCRGDNERQLWGVTDGVHIIGVVEYYIREHDAICITNIAVAEEEQKRGSGSFMIAELREKFKLPVELETDDDVIGFYRKCGFKTEPFEKYGVRRWKCTLI